MDLDAKLKILEAQGKELDANIAECKGYVENDLPFPIQLLSPGGRSAAEAKGDVFWDGVFVSKFPGIKFSARIDRFSDIDRLKVLQQTAAVVNSIDHALSDFKLLGDGSVKGTIIQSHVNRWFAGGENITKNELSKIVNVYSSVKTLILGGKLEVIAAPSYDAYGCAFRGRVYLGKHYFGSNPIDQFGTLIHEISHLVGTNDYSAYFVNPGSIQNDNPIKYTNPLTREQRINHADTYARYLTQYYRTS